MKPVCLVIGAGAGIGGNVGKRLAREGCHAVLCRRSNEAGLRQLVTEIEAEGGSASGFLLKAVDAWLYKWEISPRSRCPCRRQRAARASRISLDSRLFSSSAYSSYPRLAED